MFKEKNKLANTFGIEMDENADFIKLGDWVKAHPNQDLIVRGFLITNGGNYGKSISVIYDRHTFVNLPKRCVDFFESLSPEEVKEVLAGKLKLTNFEYVTAKNGNQTWAFEYDDVEA